MRIVLSVLALVLAPVGAQAQDYGYRFELNGRVFTTNPNTMSGPGGCRSNLMNVETGEMVCPMDRIADPQSVWRGYVARFCGVVNRDRYSGYGFYGNDCIGGYVAVGDNCPQRPHGCRYYRVAEEGTLYGTWLVPASRIHELGNELWIAKPGSALMGLLSRCWEAQGIPNRALSRC